MNQFFSRTSIDCPWAQPSPFVLNNIVSLHKPAEQLLRLFTLTLSRFDGGSKGIKYQNSFTVVMIRAMRVDTGVRLLGIKHSRIHSFIKFSRLYHWKWGAHQKQILKVMNKNVLLEWWTTDQDPLWHGHSISLWTHTSQQHPFRDETCHQEQNTHPPTQNQTKTGRTFIIIRLSRALDEYPFAYPQEEINHVFAWK